MTKNIISLDINWEGPFRWPRNVVEDANFPDYPGIYLWTIEYIHGGYIIYAAGITRRTIHKRFQEHTHNIRNGIYTLFDLEAMKQGQRKEIWHGFWMGKRSPKKEKEFELRRLELEELANHHLDTIIVFTAEVSVEDRILERLEASVMENLYNLPKPLSEIPDRGMQLSPRWDSESPIDVKNASSEVLQVTPKMFLIGFFGSTRRFLIYFFL